jgi:tetratricopeptide (TPR) repeat protein
MLRAMSIAAARFATNAAVDDQKRPRTDVPAFLAAWKRLEEVQAIAGRQLTRYGTDEDPLTAPRKALFNAFLTMQRTAEFLASNAQGDKATVKADANQLAELARIQEVATRTYADAIEPTLGATSEPALLQSVAFALDELGDASRAGRIYDLALKAVGRHPGVAAYRADPKAWLDDFQAKILVREERALQDAVRLIRDLLEDSPGTRDALAKGLSGSDLTEKPINFTQARRAITALRTLVNEPNRRTLLGERHASVVTAIDEADRTVGQLNQEIAMLSRRAATLRSEGKKAEANAIYNRLIEYDPLDAEFQSARIDITLDLIKAGQKVDKATVEKAIQDAIGFRATARAGTERWWLASIQVMELSIANGDPSPVDDWLRRMRVDNSDISVDLIAPPPMGAPADAKGVRRARDQQAVALAGRFLQLYAANGVKEKPGFRIDSVEVDGRRLAVFVAPDTPALEAIQVTDPNTDDTWTVLWEKGKPPPVIDLRVPDAPATATGAAAASSTTAAGK